MAEEGDKGKEEGCTRNWSNNITTWLLAIAEIAINWRGFVYNSDHVIRLVIEKNDKYISIEYNFMYQYDILKDGTDAV